VKDEGGRYGRQGQERQGKGSETKRPETAAEGSEEAGETTEKNVTVQSFVFSQKSAFLRRKDARRKSKVVQ
jgi:hypothetical protein